MGEQDDTRSAMSVLAVTTKKHRARRQLSPVVTALTARPPQPAVTAPLRLRLVFRRRAHLSQQDQCHDRRRQRDHGADGGGELAARGPGAIGGDVAGSHESDYEKAASASASSRQTCTILWTPVMDSIVSTRRCRPDSFTAPP